MKYYSNCYDKDAKPVTLVVRAETEDEAREILLSTYKVTEIVQITPYKLYKANSFVENINRAPKNTVGYQRSFGRKKVYC